jgi:hypothetical protein
VIVFQVHRQAGILHKSFVGIAKPRPTAHKHELNQLWVVSSRISGGIVWPTAQAMGMEARRIV